MPLLHVMSHLQKDSLVFPGFVMFPHHEDWNDFEEVAVTLLYYHDPPSRRAPHWWIPLYLLSHWKWDNNGTLIITFLKCFFRQIFWVVVFMVVPSWLVGSLLDSNSSSCEETYDSSIQLYNRQEQIQTNWAFVLIKDFYTSPIKQNPSTYDITQDETQREAYKTQSLNNQLLPRFYSASFG
jgi:hypothetical protein